MLCRFDFSENICIEKVDIFFDTIVNFKDKNHFISIFQDDPHLVEEPSVRYSRPWARRSRVSQDMAYQSNVIQQLYA